MDARQDTKMPDIARGFTLIELLVVVAIISLLASIALPAYRDYILSSRIPDGTSALAAKRVQLETFFDNNRTYVGFDCTSGGTENFAFSCPVQTANTYTIQAAGRGSMANFTFAIDQANNRTSAITESGWSPGGNCWITSKGKSC